MKAFVSLLIATWVASVAAQSSGLLVHTEQGDVTGSLVSPTVRQFLGIPYAVAGRWESPKLPPNRNGPFEASQYGDSCIQNNNPFNLEFLKLTGAVIPNGTESENCMSVNIWSPSVDRKQGTAVMVWIYGGGLTFGTSNLPIYDGRFIVRDHDDVTVVTFNYRLDIFGQPNAPQLAGEGNPQNFGLLDMNAAITWVHDNIANFGGDPDRIILFGQSAGGVAIDAYTFTHPDDTIVKGVIELSGAISSNVVIAQPGPNTAAWNNVSSAVGCGTILDAAQLACMKKVPGRTLKDAVIRTNSSFQPIQDNVTIFSDILTRAAAGNFLKVPLLAGTTANEADIFVVAFELVTLGSAIPILTQVTADFATHAIFTCSANAIVQNRRNAGVPAWRYQYQGVFPDISTRPDLRAYHASELPIIFGTYNQTIDIPPTPEEIALSNYMQSAWVAFARDPQRGLSDFGWPMYNPSTSTIVQLGGLFNRTGFTLGSSFLIDLGCGDAPTLAAMANPAGTLFNVTQ